MLAETTVYYLVYIVIKWCVLYMYIDSGVKAPEGRIVLENSPWRSHCLGDVTALSTVRGGRCAFLPRLVLVTA